MKLEVTLMIGLDNDTTDLELDRFKDELDSIDLPRGAILHTIACTLKEGTPLTAIPEVAPPPEVSGADIEEFNLFTDRVFERHWAKYGTELFYIQPSPGSKDLDWDEAGEVDPDTMYKTAELPAIPLCFRNSYLEIADDNGVVFYRRHDPTYKSLLAAWLKQRALHP